MIFDSSPLRPGADQAREWAKHELSKPKYADHTSWLERGLTWLSDHLESLLRGAGGKGGLSLVIVAAALLIALAVWRITRTRRPDARRSTAPDTAVLTDARRSSAALRADAAHAADRGDLDEAALDWFRAMARHGQEQHLLPADEHFTSHDVAAAFGRMAADLSGDFAWAATTFDRVRYGHARASADEVRRLRELDSVIRARRAPREVTV